MSRSSAAAKTANSAASIQNSATTTTPTTPITFWQRAILASFHVLLFAVPLYFTWFNTELFEFNKIILTYVVTILVLFFWIGRSFAEKAFHIRRTPFDVPIVLFLISQVLSTIFSIDPHTSIFGYYTRFNGGLLSWFCYVALFYAFVSNVRRRDLPALWRTAFASSILVSLWAILEHFGHSLSCLFINLYRYRGQTLPTGWFGQFFDDSCWIQDVQTRVFASFGQPNWLAAYDITLIPAGIALAVAEWNNNRNDRARWLKILFFSGSTLLLLMTLIFTKSRSGFGGLALGVVVLGVGVLIALWQARDTLQRKVVLIPSITLAAACLALVIIFGTPYTKNYGEALLTKPAAAPTAAAASSATAPTQPSAAPTPTPDPSTINRLDIGGTDSGEIRQIVWTGAIKVWERYPILGSGVETFAYSYYLDRPMAHNLVSEWDFLYNKAHNEFLNFLATTGLVGFLAYVMMIGMLTAYPIWWLWLGRPSDSEGASDPASRRGLSPGWRPSSPTDILFAFAVASGLLALHVSNFFGFSTVMVNILLLLIPGFFLVSVVPAKWRTWQWGEVETPAATNAKSKNLNSDEDSVAIFRHMTMVIVGGIAVGALFAVWTLWRADYLYNRGKQYIQISDATDGLRDLQNAITLEPNEATYYDDLSMAYSRVAVAYADQNDATSAAQFATQALSTSTKMLALSPHNLNLHKTEVRIDMNLAQIDPTFMTQAKLAAQHAIALAPTDPKLRYFLAVIELTLGDTTNGVADLEKTVQMKPDYELARLTLGEEYEKLKRVDDAKAQFEYILTKLSTTDKEAQDHLASLSAEVRPAKKQ